MKHQFLVFVGVAVILLAARIVWAQWPTTTVLPNGFMIRGYGDILSPDGRNVMMRNVEFTCFDDRFLYATSQIGEPHMVFDNQRAGEVYTRDLVDLNLPNGLLFGRKSCNGYYTAVIGPGLLHDGAEWPFMPMCKYVNIDNPALKNRKWLNRPCEER